MIKATEQQVNIYIYIYINKHIYKEHVGMWCPDSRHPFQKHTHTHTHTLLTHMGLGVQV